MLVSPSAAGRCVCSDGTEALATRMRKEVEGGWPAPPESPCGPREDCAASERCSNVPSVVSEAQVMCAASEKEGNRGVGEGDDRNRGQLAVSALVYSAV